MGVVNMMSVAVALLQVISKLSHITCTLTLLLSSWKYSELLRQPQLGLQVTEFHYMCQHKLESYHCR